MRSVHKEKNRKLPPFELAGKRSLAPMFVFSMPFAQKERRLTQHASAAPLFPAGSSTACTANVTLHVATSRPGNLPLFQQGLKSDLFDHRFVHFLFLWLFYLVVGCRQRFFFALQHLQHMIAVAGFDWITDFI